MTAQTAYFDDPYLAQQFTEDGFEHTVQNYEAALDVCEKPEQLRTSLRHARQRAAEYFHTHGGE
ncbi:MAG TPA: hypothetical protein VJB96_00840 [Patescibacteria group bacterium]|nr:hypothetical protein [Patescibacteria group bacterium]